MSLTAEARDQPEREAAFIDRIARGIVRRGLETPAVLFLELHRPISFLGSQAVYFLAPFLRLIIPPREINQFAQLLHAPQGVERLIERIEEVANAK